MFGIDSKFSIFAAKKHLRAWVKHKTGAGPAPPALTDIDQNILRIFGQTPAFRGNYYIHMHI